MFYEKHKRDKYDRCNICGRMAELTWDHVPPKSCYNDGLIKFNSLYNGIPIEKYEGSFQNGLRYRSLCHSCNNRLLGARYDVALSEFTSVISRLIQSPLELPKTVYYKCDVNKITRAICGHLLASVNEYLDGLMFEELRGYVLNETALPPVDRKLLFRIYPHSTVIINQAFSIGIVSKENKLVTFPTGTCSVISCYPAAYVLCDDCINSGLRNIFEFCTSGIDDIVSFPIDMGSCFYPKTQKFRHYLWPCNIGDDSYSADFMVGSDDTIMGIQRSNFLPM